MKIAVVAYDDFTDVDAFLPFDFFHRVSVPYGAGYTGDWSVRLLSDKPHIRSYSGIGVETHGHISSAIDADGIFIVSGDGSRAKIADQAFLDALRLDPARQLIGAIDSGAFILAALGLLDGLSATTYPVIMDELEALGVRTEHRPLVVHGNIATAGGCLASLDLCSWMVGKLISAEAATKVRASFDPIAA